MMSAQTWERAVMRWSREVGELLPSHLNWSPGSLAASTAASDDNRRPRDRSRASWRHRKSRTSPSEVLRPSHSEQSFPIRSSSPTTPHLQPQANCCVVLSVVRTRDIFSSAPQLLHAMYEDSWYNAFVPRAAKPAERAKHRRRESLLKQPNVSLPSAPWVR